jgi:hypothetical protein
LLSARFSAPLLLSPETAAALPSVLADMCIAGGAVYDAVVALAAVENECPLATRDGRAKDTYDKVGAQVIVVG